MKILKQITRHLIWTLVSLFLGFSYVYVITNIIKDDLPKSWHIPSFAQGLVVVYVGSAIGAVIAVLFFLVDVFYLRKKLNNTFKSTMIRFLVLLTITILLAIVFYWF
jgi:hypothetical protein